MCKNTLSTKIQLFNKLFLKTCFYSCFICFDNFNSLPAQASTDDYELYWCDSRGINCQLVPEDQDFKDIKITAYKALPPLGIKSLADKEISCLAKNITQEAEKGNITDKIAVAFATINRVKDKRFPNTICGVISQKNAMSWYKIPQKRFAPPAHKDYQIAKNILLGKVANPLNIPATNWINPKLDSPNSFNHRQLAKTKTMVQKPSGAYHVFVAY